MITTVFCIYCESKAVIFGGHVHRGKKTIVTGFCEKHDPKFSPPTLKGCKGCYGRWEKKFGIKGEESSVRYIDSSGIHRIKN